MYNEDYIAPIEEDVNFDMLFEAPDDEDAGGGDAENVDLATDDQGNDNADNAAEDQNADDNADQNQNNNQNNDNQQANDDNFDIDDNDNQDEDQPDDIGGGNDAPAPQDNGEEGAENDVTDAEKDINRQIDAIYNDLSPAEKSRKDLELRNLYKEMYYDIHSLITDTERFPNTSQNKEITTRLLKNLNDFKDSIVYYLSNIYDTKSHLENRTKYYEFIQIFSGIKSIFNDLHDAMSHANPDEEDK